MNTGTHTDPLFDPTCISAYKGAPVQIVSAAHPPTLVGGLEDLETHTETMLDHTVLTQTSFTPAPWSAFKDPGKNTGSVTHTVLITRLI